MVHALDPWDAVLFHCAADGLTATGISDLLVQHGFAALTGEVTCRLTDWLRQPATALERQDDLVGTLFGERAIYTFVDLRGEIPDYDKAFGRLVESTGWSAQLVDLEQGSWEEDDPNRPAGMDYPRYVRFSHDGRRFQFEFDGGDNMDVAALLANFDAFMAGAGRPERGFELVRGPWAALTTYLVATEPAAFRELAGRLHVPVAKQEPASATLKADPSP